MSKSDLLISSKLMTWRCKEADLKVSKLEAGSRILDKNDPPTAGFDQNPALLGRVSKTSIDTTQSRKGRLMVDALRQSIDNLNREVEVLKWQ